MRIEQTILNKTFIIKQGKKEYWVNYINSDGQTLDLLNRDFWEVKDENGEEIDTYCMGTVDKKKKIKAEKNRCVIIKLIEFCIKHFYKYRPKLKISTY